MAAPPCDLQAPLLNGVSRELAEPCDHWQALVAEEAMPVAMKAVAAGVLASRVCQIRAAGATVAAGTLTGYRADKVQPTKVFRQLNNNAVKDRHPARPQQTASHRRIPAPAALPSP